MNKTQLVEAVAKEARLSKSDAASAVNALVDTVQKSLKKGDDVSITGFGKFSVTRRGARTEQPRHRRADQDQSVKDPEVLARGHAPAGRQGQEALNDRARMPVSPVIRASRQTCRVV